MALSASTNGSPLTTSSRTPKNSHAAATSRTTSNARARTSCSDGSSNLVRLRPIQVSWAAAQARSHSTPTMSSGMPRRNVQRTTCTTTQPATTKTISRIASGFAAAPKMPKAAPTSTPGRICDGAQTIADATLTA